MKNIKTDLNDSLRPEYRRSDFGELVQGRYTGTQVPFAELVRLLLVCIGEDENVTFSHYSAGNLLAGRKPGDWTYEIDSAHQITLRFWISEFENIEERITNLRCIMTSQDRIELQGLLVKHVQKLKTRTTSR